MRLALIASVDGDDRKQAVDRLARRLRQPDAGFTVEHVMVGPELPESLRIVVRGYTDAGHEPDLLVVMAVPLALDADGAAVVAARGGDVSFERICGALPVVAGAALVVIDAVHVPDPEDPAASASLIGMVRDAVGPRENGMALMVVARPDGATADGAPLVDVLFRSLDGATAESSGAAALFERIRDDEVFHRLPAKGFFRGGRELHLIAPPRFVMPEPSAPMAAPTPEPPPVSEEPARTQLSEPPAPHGPPSSDEGPPPSSLKANAPPKPSSRRGARVAEAAAPPAAEAASPAAPAPEPPSGPASAPSSIARTQRSPSQPPPASGSQAPSSRRAPLSSRPPPPSEVTVDGMMSSGDLHAAAGRYDAAIADYKKALLMLGSTRADQRTALYYRIGQGKLAQKSHAEAISNFEKALALDPLHEQSFTATARLLVAQREYDRLDRLHRKRLSALPDDAARLRTWNELATLWTEEAKNPKLALAALEQAHALQPDDADTLERLLEIEAELGRHAVAVAHRRRLAELVSDDPPRKARQLTAAARAIEEHLPHKEEAIDLALQAIIVEPTALEALEFVAERLVRKRRYADLAHAYELVLERTRDEVLGLDLARRLGVLYRDQLDDAQGAVLAFTKALELDESDVELRFWVAELHEAARRPLDAARQFRQAARFAPRRPDVYRRALWLLEKTDRRDATWCAAAALDFLGDADINESLLADTHRPEGSLAVQRGLHDEEWNAGLLAPEADRAVSAVFRAIAPAVIAVKLDELNGLGRLRQPDPAARQDPSSSTTTLARSLQWSARLLGMPVPELYVLDEVPGTLALHPGAPPVALASRALGRGMELPELAFLWARHLVLHRPEHYLTILVPSLPELASVLLAALHVAGRTDGESDEIIALGDALEERLDDDAEAALDLAVERFDTSRAARRIEAWRHSVELQASRAGLLACGDIARAAELARRFPLGGDWSIDELVDDLIAYSVSEAYGELRERIGVAIP